ncbi:PREDICTED: Werner Syndrome-like exonuclease isoform X3 [Ipomoea nil]|uniref:Werner Syndrome-like exonuclease isoform X3 n=1 Tax=Ipomoea nil TaxID=35883 RepID=UPI0009012996|nr:PREDICTED: Werner Syndrome-like exonuclease isoform X3 [Ipomoea nil]
MHLWLFGMHNKLHKFAWIDLTDFFFYFFLFFYFFIFWVKKMNELVMSRARLPKLAFRGRVIYSRTKDEVEKSAAELLHVIEEKTRQEESVALGFDTEWKPSFVKGVSPGKAAVIQICGDMDNCYVFHIFHSGISQSLQLLLENSTPKLAKGNYIRLGDWETTSLSKEQLNYAATDAYTSWQLYHELKKLPDVDKESN